MFARRSSVPLLVLALVTFDANARAEDPDAVRAPALPATELGKVYDGARVAASLRTFAMQSATSRVTRGVVAAVSGASLVGAGLVAHFEFDQTYGQPLAITGATILALGAWSLVLPGPLERLASDDSLAAPDALRAAWKDKAQVERKNRRVTGVVTMALGALAAGSGLTLAFADLGMSPSARRDWSIAALVGAGSLVGSGLVSFLVESDVEVGYRVAYGEGATRTHLTAGFAPASGGGTAFVGGSF
ncbi:MAG: hypothetical protein U0169_11110 [Polyangiaceae bacterium]